jgi:nucleotide-binding universal stress UspA family protein
MNINRLLVGIDFSAPSVEAAQWVARHFAPDAELVLLHVISTPNPAPIESASAEKQLRGISESMNAKGITLEIREGDPVEILDAVAAEFSADIIVAGTHSKRPGLQNALGSTAEHLVRASERPVLLVTGPRLTGMSHVLVPVAKAEAATDALRWAGVLSRQFQARVTALHVVTAGAASGALAALTVVSGTPPIDPVTQVATAKTSDQWVESAVAAGVPRERASGEVAFGEATGEILSAVERLGADLVVMGRRSAGDLRRAVLGSVVDGVLRGSTCPVLVVPER